jgi:hypothetical protein
VPIKLYAANINIAFEPEEKAKPKNTGIAKVYIALEDHLKIPLFSKGIFL